MWGLRFQVRTSGFRACNVGTEATTEPSFWDVFYSRYNKEYEEIIQAWRGKGVITRNTRSSGYSSYEF